ncbi:hypothetical protein TrVFT333_000889 [Trichoderma virens FT-333]|nr:hypothetical protein TrVFT333_000889 [Trichoderma virens FT-333]
MRETKPPPYEENGDIIQDDDSYHGKAFIPPWITNKIMQIGSHKERVRLVEEYITRKGEIVKEKEMALTCQNRALNQAIKDAKKDANNLKKTYHQTLWSISYAKEHPNRTFWGLAGDDFGWNKFAYESLAAVRKSEAQITHKMETEKIEIAFQEAVKKFDEEYNVLLDYMSEGNRQVAAVEI